MAVCVGCGLEVTGGVLSVDTGSGVTCDPSLGISAFLNGSTAFVTTLESTTSTAYTDLATVGPTVTIVTGTVALLFWDAVLTVVSGGPAKMSVAVSGASSAAASDDFALTSPSTGDVGTGFYMLYTGLTAGSNTFTAKYKTQTPGTAFFDNRRLIVIP